MIIIGLAILLFFQLVILYKLFTQKSSGEKENYIKLDQQISHLEDSTRKDFGINREENQKSILGFKKDIQNSFQLLGNELIKQIHHLNATQKQQSEDHILRLEKFENNINKNLNDIRLTVEEKLRQLQNDNHQKLEEMRKTVDEKLEASIEKRFDQSFKLISERLEQVHKGLGEMQTLASGVGDLKKVLTNVKTRGNLGEIQLGNILEQVLSPEQYLQNTTIRPNTSERVEFAIKLPGKSLDNAVLLPIDSKFPNEDYQRLLDAYDHRENTIEFEVASKQFENAVKKSAKDIKEKYIFPPYSTDFAIMFVPTEGLYAEILRRNGLFELLQRNFKITVVGPTNLVAFLSSLQMGFKTLAIEKRSSEVWEILGAVKTEFGNFGGILEKTKKKLLEATNVIDSAGIRSRAIERKLKEVQELPKDKSQQILDGTPLSLPDNFDN